MNNYPWIELSLLTDSFFYVKLNDFPFCHFKNVLFQNSKLFHVRPVTQGDVYRAETDEIPRIFQVSYLFFSQRFYLKKKKKVM